MSLSSAPSLISGVGPVATYDPSIAATLTTMPSVTNILSTTPTIADGVWLSIIDSPRGPGAPLGSLITVTPTTTTAPYVSPSRLAPGPPGIANGPGEKPPATAIAASAKSPSTAAAKAPPPPPALVHHKLSPGARVGVALGTIAAIAAIVAAAAVIGRLRRDRRDLRNRHDRCAQRGRCPGEEGVELPTRARVSAPFNFQHVYGHGDAHERADAIQGGAGELGEAARPGPIRAGPDALIGIALTT